MAILSPTDADQVRTYFTDNLQEPVTIALFTQKRSPLLIPGHRECETCEDTEQLLGEVAALSGKVTLDVHDFKADPGAGAADGVTPAMIPAFVLRGQDRGKIRFMGVPGGYEFTTLIQDIATVSKGTTSLAQATRDELARLTDDVHIRVFVTPT